MDGFAGEPTIKQRFARHAKHYVNVEHSDERFECVYETWSTGIRVIPIKRPSVSSCIILSANKRGRVFFAVQFTRDFLTNFPWDVAPLTRSKTNRPLFTKLLVFRSGIVQTQTRVYVARRRNYRRCVRAVKQCLKRRLLHVVRVKFYNRVAQTVRHSSTTPHAYARPYISRRSNDLFRAKMFCSRFGTQKNPLENRCTEKFIRTERCVGINGQRIYFFWKPTL